ncbi:hypothetical protein HYH02_007154 [Chlamydomonas schloesseri]|uniref:Nuclear pore complex protein Nup88 n=1 Tax=Chlamydomonas schloesseri TaxID=2026947 RepID=A0A835WI61_9CHLO|nr:hypothetical protein HYH02_007154 [Chlamydomonas schloesseri]|eukprot:KAG2447694.1 hypothetical protein HYH02_007154 [Chlamydomonas schloesseri]
MEEQFDLRDVIALDADAAGTVYALWRSEDGGLRIVLIDGRQEVLDAQQRQASLQDPVAVAKPTATHIVHTNPPVNFDARGLRVTPSGRYVALYGNSHEDSSVISLAVVDLHGGQPLAMPPGSTVRHKQCRLLAVDSVLFGSRPGLVLYQVSWHAHSEEHLVVLTSDNRLRLYHVTHSLAVAEQTLHVVPQAGPLPQRYGLSTAAAAGGPGTSPGPAASPHGGGGTAGGASGSSDVVAFSFGPALGWGLFSILLLGTDGLVYSLGPVAPFGMRCSGALLQRLAADEAAAEEWLAAAFGTDAVENPAARSRWPVLPHVVEDVSPALMGPLNPRLRQELPHLTARAVGLAVAHTITAASASAPAANGTGTPSSAAGPAPTSVSTAVVGYADGRLLAYAVAGAWVPAWCDNSPQYMTASGAAGSAPSAVRYRCTLRTGGAGAGGGGPAAGLGLAFAAAAGEAAPAAVTPRMVLLDVVELPVDEASGPPVPAAAQKAVVAVGVGASTPGSTGRFGLADVDSEDEEDDEDGELYGGGGSAVPRRPMSLHMQAGAAGAAAATAWVSLRNRGCWSVTLPWCALLPRWLGGPGGAAAAEALPSDLPAPVVKCVHEVAAAAAGSMTPAGAATAAGGAVVVDSCLLANPLLGGGLLMLSRSGTLHYYQPAGAAELVSHQAAAAAAAAASTPGGASGSIATPGGGAGLSPLASPEQRKAAVEAHIRAVYGSLVAPPADRKLPKPPAGAPTPLTVAIPEGLRHLTDCIAALRATHIPFLTGASLDLTARADALRAEAAKHAAAVADLTDLAAAAEARQAALEARVARLKSLHENLVERAAVLASLHWSLPRALSHAERDMRDQLSALEARATSLDKQWGALASRTRRLCDERRSASGPGGALRSGTGIKMAAVPEAQLEKVHEAVVAQYRGLTAARAALTALEQHAAAAVADRTAEHSGGTGPSSSGDTGPSSSGDTGPGSSGGTGPSSSGGDGAHVGSGGGRQGHVEEESAAPPKKRRKRAG